jgi:pimeloyl-ACP methyl ester carboxylesterase
LTDALLHLRVLAFDRPGFGHSTRPRARLWTPTAQAQLLASALARLGVRQPVIVAHSWGTLVALALALEYPRDITGLVLLSGYYFPTIRSDALMSAPAAVPLLGDILDYTIMPSLTQRLPVGAPCLEGGSPPRSLIDRRCTMPIRSCGMTEMFSAMLVQVPVPLHILTSHFGPIRCTLRISAGLTV